MAHRTTQVRRPTPAYLEHSKTMYRSFASIIIALGWWYILSPQWFYGPSWSYFHQLPHNGFGLGLCCIGLGALQLVVIQRELPQPWVLALLLFLAALTFWMSGLILGAEGIAGHQGLQEAPLMMTIAIHKGAHSGNLFANWRRERSSK